MKAVAIAAILVVSVALSAGGQDAPQQPAKDADGGARPQGTTPGRPARPPSTRTDAFVYPRFSNRAIPTGKFKNDVSLLRKRIEPLPSHDVRDTQRRLGTTATKTSGPFQFHFKDEMSGTNNEIGSFSLSDASNGTHCFKVREGSFVRTRCI